MFIYLFTGYTRPGWLLHPPLSIGPSCRLLDGPNIAGSSITGSSRFLNFTNRSFTPHDRDEMGLGKTVQAIATLLLLHTQGPYGGRPVVRRCLIVTPSSLIEVSFLCVEWRWRLNAFLYWPNNVVFHLAYSVTELGKGNHEMGGTWATAIPLCYAEFHIQGACPAYPVG